MSDTSEIEKTTTGDGMPLGNQLTPMLQPKQVTTDPAGVKEVKFDDDAAMTIAWQDYRNAATYIDSNSWLMEWQYIDYLYQSPNYDRDWRSQSNRPQRISRFNVARNRNTMSAQVRRAIFAGTDPFLLEPRGKLAGKKNAQIIIDAWTEIIRELLDRADFTYNMRLGIECQVLQGTAIWIPNWETKTTTRTVRRRQKQPVTVELPAGSTKVNTWESDDFKAYDQQIKESWPTFEYRRLGTTLYSEKWRTPNRPDLTGWPRIDIDYVTFQDLQEMRKLTCYKKIPDDEGLKTYFLSTPQGDAAPATEVAQNMNANSTTVMHAAGDNTQKSQNPFLKPLMKIAYWMPQRVTEILVYEDRKLTIRNEEHGIGRHAAGYTANWYNIDNSGYGFGTGRLNAGDQRMTQGVLNEVLKMIAFPLNAPLLYDKSAGDAPTQNTITGLGTFLGVNTGRMGDVNKALSFMRMPEIPPEAWRVYEMAKADGEDIVGANQTTMQGQLGGPGSSFGRTAAGVNRLSSKADENVADPVDQLETVIQGFIEFLVMMVLEEMPIKEIRDILSDRFGEAILEEIDSETFMQAQFNVKVLAGQHMMARAAISQLIPFLLQLVQQPTLMQFMHQKGWTVNFKAIEDLYMQMSELAGRQDIIIPLSDEEKQMVQQMQPGVQKIQEAMTQEQLKGKNALAVEQERGANKIKETILDKSLEHIAGSVPLELAEARGTRNTDLNILENGVAQ